MRTVTENGIREAVFSVDGAKVYICKFNRVRAEKDLAWALEFWENTREAEPTSNPNKCLRCEHKVCCQDSIH